MKIKNLSLVALAALALASCGNNAPAPVEAEPVKIEPGEQAPLADPGQKNFGGMATGAPRDTTGMAERMAIRSSIRTRSPRPTTLPPPAVVSTAARTW